ncbi:MAG: hypothetical protein MJ240_13460 [Kiritimatiellae bacterium]|nr:hypothetical protein [Kiritimatiellia bacterium]
MKAFCCGVALIAGALAVQGAARPLAAEVKMFGGAPALFLDGRPDTGLMHWNRWMTPADVTAFREAGVHLYSFMGAPEMPNPDGGPVNYADGLVAKVPILSPESIDKMMAMIVAADPEAKVLLRFRMTTPDWWRAAHPGETVKVYDLRRGEWREKLWGSPASKAWLAMCDAAIRRMVRHCEAKWGDRIFGYHPGLGCCAENSYDWGASIGDYSACAIKDFGAPPPDPEVFASRALGDTRRLLDPKKDATAIAFQRHQSKVMADAVLSLAHSVKDELAQLGRKKICGVFYGYFCFPANLTEFLASGHYDFARVLASPEIDMICAPLNYTSRALGNAAFAQTLPGSIALHGKLYYGEEDTRFHTAHDDRDCVARDIRDTRNLLHRNFLNLFAHGGSVWWMDLFGNGWYRDPALREDLVACREFAEAHLAHRHSAAQIAVFVSERAVAAERAAPVPLSNETLSPMFDEIAACGAPYDAFLLEDLPLLVEKGRLSAYRLAIVPNAHSVSPELRAAIRQSLCADNRTVIFLGKPGWQDGGAAGVADLTGIEVVASDSRDDGLVEAFPDARRIVWGQVRRSDPQFTITDADAVARGWYVQGAYHNHPRLRAQGVALAEKRFAVWRSVLCCVPLIPSDLLQRFAKESGVHIYSPHGDQVIAGEDWFAVAAKMSGVHTLTPRAGVPEFTADIARGELRLFKSR